MCGCRFGDYWRARRLWRTMIRAADMHGQRWLLRPGVGRDGGVFPLGEINRMSQGGDAAESDGQIKNARTAAFGRIEGDRLDRAARHDRLHQITEHMTRADLDKGAHAAGDHRLNLLHEIDRAHDLAGQQVARIGFGLRVLASG